MAWWQNRHGETEAETAFVLAVCEVIWVWKNKKRKRVEKRFEESEAVV